MPRADDRKAKKVTHDEANGLRGRRLRPPQHLHADLLMFESHDRDADQFNGITKVQESGFSMADILARAREYATPAQKRNPPKITGIVRCSNAEHVAGLS